MSKKDFEDDNRTIVDMSLTKSTPWSLSFSPLAKRNDKLNKDESKLREAAAEVYLTKEERRTYIFSAMLAGLTVGLVFVGGAFLFILFCVYIWF